jgi:protein SCO1
MNIGRLSSYLLCCGLLACARHESPESAAPQRSASVASPQLARVAPTTSVRASIYDLRVPLRDETGAVRPLDTFRGHPVLITMFYGSCPVACPILTTDLKRLERQIPAQLRSDVRILMVSFDPDRDTPAALAELKRERALDNERWTLASTGEDEARELAGVLDIKYRKVDGGAFFHSSVIVLLDRQGRPQARLDGAGTDISAMLSALGRPSI